MEIKGSKNKYYTVDLDELTCTCKDWTCRRHNFPKNNENRLCKHLKEAIELNRTIGDKKSVSVPNSVIDELGSILTSSNKILRFNVYNNIILVRLINDYPGVLNNELSSIGFRQISNDGFEYDGMNFQVIKCTSDNYLFNRLYYSLSKDEFIKLSSLVIRKLNLRLTTDGFINSKGNKVDLEIYTEDELYELLGIELT